MMKEELSKTMFQVLDLCSPGKKPTLDGGLARRCEYVQLFKWEPSLDT